MLIHQDHIRTDPAFRDRLQACKLDRVGSILERVDGNVVAWSRTTDTLHVAAPDGAPGFFVKRYYYPRWKNRFRGAFRGTLFGAHRALAEYNTLRAMQNAGIPTVRPVAVGCRRVARLITGCFLITEEVPESTNLTTYAQRCTEAGTAPSLDERGRALRTLARQVALLHCANMSHGQLFWRNILIRRGVGDEPEFFFLDAQPLRRLERIPGRQWWLRELAQLAVSAEPFTSPFERLRFAAAYFKAFGLRTLRREDLQTIERFVASYRAHERQRVKMNALFDRWGRQLAQERATLDTSALEMTS